MKRKKSEALTPPPANVCMTPTSNTSSGSVATSSTIAPSVCFLLTVFNVYFLFMSLPTDTPRNDCVRKEATKRARNAAKKRARKEAREAARNAASKGSETVTTSVRQADGSFKIDRHDGRYGCDKVAYPVEEAFDILAARANEFNVWSQRSPKGSKYKLFSSYSIFYLVFMLIDAPLTETKNGAPQSS